MSIRLLLRTIGVVLPLSLCAINLWVIWWLLALGGLFADVGQLRSFFIAELLFVFAATAISTGIHSADKDRDSPPVFEAFALAVGTLPALAQSTVGAFFQANWTNPDIASGDLPNLFAALLYWTAGGLTWHWYVGGLVLLAGFALIVSYVTASRTAAGFRASETKNSLRLYFASLGLLTLYLLLLSPDIVSRDAAHIDSVAVLHVAAIAVGLIFLICFLVLVARSFRGFVLQMQNVDLRLLKLAAYVAVILFVASLLVWGAWEAAKSSSRFFESFAEIEPQQDSSVSVDLRPLMGLIIVFAAIFAIAASARLLRLDWLEFAKRAREFSGRIALTALAGVAATWRVVKSLVWTARKPILAAVAVLLLGPTASSPFIGTDLVEPPPRPPPRPPPPPPTPPPPRVHFDLVSLNCAPLRWEYASPDTLEASLEDCSIRDADVRYVVSIGRASFEPFGRTRENQRAQERAERLAAAIQRGSTVSSQIFTLNLGMMRQQSPEARTAYVIVGRGAPQDRNLSFDEFVTQLAGFLAGKPEIAGATQCTLMSFPTQAGPVSLNCETSD